MIDKRLFKMMEKKNLFLLVVVRLFYLLLSIFMWWVFAVQFTNLLQTGETSLGRIARVFIFISILKIILNKYIEHLTIDISFKLRMTMRNSIVKKSLKLAKREDDLSVATLAQLSVEGIEQLDNYYARFLPQLFYSVFAALIIFISLAMFALKPAIILLLCLPLIPIVIMSVMKIAKRILSGYWSTYTNLGEKFHENLQGLSTLKSYNQDQMKQKEMTENSNNFKKITMKLLAVQLNSILVMDVISYCGAALGIGLALFAYYSNELTLTGVFMFILLSAEFFIPMRQLGSLFHVAMNGVSACKKLFDYLELPERVYGNEINEIPLITVRMDQVDFAYENTKKKTLQKISFEAHQGEFTAIVGSSGSGKSTIFRLLLHQLNDYEGSIFWNEKELRELTKKNIIENALLVDNQGYLYSTTIKENLIMGNVHISDEKIWSILEKVQLTAFIKKLSKGLMTELKENGANLSGGQRQRLLLARALLRDSSLYVFDEITSGVDLKSEEIIVRCLKDLAKSHIVLFISHRLYNVLDADNILVFNQGKLVESGSPSELLQKSNYFKNYFQQEKMILDGK